MAASFALSLQKVCLRNKVEQNIIQLVDVRRGVGELTSSPRKWLTIVTSCGG